MENWQQSKLGEVYDVRDGTHDSPRYQKSGYPLITSKNLKSHGLDFSTAKFISESDHLKISKRSAVSHGDILFAMIGTIGNPVVVQDSPSFSIKNVALFKVPINQNSFFLKYYLQSKNVVNKMEKEAKGSTQKFVGLRYLRNFPIYLPQLSEQKQIVAILDEAFAAIATATANTERNLANAKELFEEILNNTFSSEDHWERKPLSEILLSQPRNGWSPPAKHHSESGIPVLTLSSVTGFEFKPNKIKYTSSDVKYDAHYWVKNGDLLITRSNTPELVGHVAICSDLSRPTIYPDLIMKMRINENVVNTRFVYYQLRTRRLRQVIMSSAKGANPTMKKINKSVVQTLPVSYPNITHQSQMIDRFDSFLKKQKCLNEVGQRKLTLLTELKQSLLHKAFTGELTADPKIVDRDLSKAGV